MKKINQSRLAALAGVTRQAVSLAIDEGIIPFVMDGRTRAVDLDDPEVKEYIAMTNTSRENRSNKKLEELKSMIVPEERAAIDRLAKHSPKVVTVLLDAAKKVRSEKREPKPPKPATPSKLPAKKSPKPVSASGPAGPQVPSDIDAHEIRRRAQYADMLKKEAQAAILEKRALPRDYVEEWLFKYLEKLNSTVERTASVSLDEIGGRILEAGRVLPEHSMEFTNLILQAIHNTKKAIVKSIKDYEPRL